MPYALPPITLTQNLTSQVSLPGNMGSVSYLKLINASPYLLLVTNLLGGQDYMQPGEANVWPVPGLSTTVQVTPQQFGISPAIIPSTVLVVTWYLDGEQPNGNYPVNFNTISFLGSSVTTNASTPNSINQDEWTPFVLQGLTAAKDGTNANRLDVASGVAWLRQSDQSLGRQALNATTFTTVQINSTYFLDLTPDGTYSFATSHSGQPNYLPIAQVTTDASGNILVVTDERVTATTLLSSMIGTLNLPGAINVGSGGNGLLNVSGDVAMESSRGLNAILNILQYHPAAQAFGYLWQTWDGANAHNSFAVGGNFAGPYTYIGPQGNIAQVNLQPTVGSLGVPVIVAQAINSHVTTTGSHAILSFTPSATGLYRVSGSGSYGNNTVQSIAIQVQYHDPNLATPTMNFYELGRGLFLNGASATLSPNTSLALAPMTIYAASGSAISCFYNDPPGTPNDFISFVIERLS